MKEMKYYDHRVRPSILLDRGTMQGYEYVILSLGTHPCAYVCIPLNHVLHETHYDDCDIECHGGLTYSQYGLHNWHEYSDKYNAMILTGISDETWVIGWDYAHYQDYMGYYPSDSGRRWTTQQIKRHIEEVINQLIDYDKEW